MIVVFGIGFLFPVVLVFLQLVGVLLPMNAWDFPTYLGLISVMPNFFFIWLNNTQYQNFPFGGVAVLIMVGVGLETVKQIESQLMQRNYEGFLR